ncbi:tRNA:m(4)X modification enzyme TRM13 [Dissophora globulifera]|nr:tRNA:m(4)X modification enzyme TRM13 [Dissophora globulifera]
MSDTKRPLIKDPEPVAKALAGTLEPLVLNHRPRNKRQKVHGPPPPIPSRPRQCHFLSPSKNKYCTLTTKLGNKFCGEHSMHEVSSGAGSDNAQDGGEDGASARKRIPCPFDPSHTAWADDLKTHLYKCNARPRENKAHFSLDINLALPRLESPVDPITMTEDEILSTPSDNKAKRDLLAKLSQEQLLSLIKKIQSLHAKYVPSIRTLILDHPALDERKKMVKNIKHAHQQASLLGHMKRLNMLDDPTSCYVEFGAGRGELSNYLKVAVDDHGSSTFVLIDRTPSRNKFDSAILGLEEIKSLVKRYTIDIKDLVLAKVPELRRDVTATQRVPPVAAKQDTNTEADQSSQQEQEYMEKKPVVAMSKHLCGGATDLTLKCLTNYQQSERGQSLLPSPVKGILIALCCHQLCHHYMYPNQEFLKEIGINPEEFVYMTRMSSWAVSVNQTKAVAISTTDIGTGRTLANDDNGSTDSPAAQDDEHQVETDSELEELGSHIPALDFQARERLGQQCKRLLDIGRVRYLNENGFDAELVYYVDQETSLENLALMAVPTSSNK